jgi:hypothetical protein
VSNLTINTREQFEFTFSKEAEKEIILILKNILLKEKQVR